MRYLRRDQNFPPRNTLTILFRQAKYRRAQPIQHGSTRLCGRRLCVQGLDLLAKARITLKTRWHHAGNAVSSAINQDFPADHRGVGVVTLAPHAIRRTDSIRSPRGPDGQPDSDSFSGTHSQFAFAPIQSQRLGCARCIGGYIHFRGLRVLHLCGNASRRVRPDSRKSAATRIHKLIS